MRESICESRRSGVPSFYFTFPQNDASEPVILSAADAKDLLSVSGEPKQVLRSRAYRALAQDDNAASLRKRKIGKK